MTIAKEALLHHALNKINPDSAYDGSINSLTSPPEGELPSNDESVEPTYRRAPSIVTGVAVLMLLGGCVSASSRKAETPTAVEIVEGVQEELGLIPTLQPTETLEQTQIPEPTPTVEIVYPDQPELFGAGGYSEEFAQRVESGEFGDQKELLKSWVDGPWSELGIFHPETERVHYKYFQDLETQEVVVGIESEDYPNQIIYYPLDLEATQEMGKQVFDDTLPEEVEKNKYPLFLTLSGPPLGTNISKDANLAVKNGNWVMVNLAGETVGEINPETVRWQEVEFSDFEQVSEILSEIKREFGVEIPETAKPEYTAGERRLRIYNQSGMEILNNGENAVLNVDEALAFKEVLNEIPYAGSLVDLILVYRYKSDPDVKPLVTHGAYWGYRYEDWLKFGPRPYYLPVHENQTLKQIAIQYGFESMEELYSINEDILDSFEPDSVLEPGTELKMYQGSLEGRKKAIMIYLPENFYLNNPLPDLSQHSPLMFVNEEDLHFLNQPEEINYSTQKDYFKRVLFHEFGHAVSDAISEQFASTEKEYVTERGMKGPLHFCGLISMDELHPLYQAFAELNGWKLVSHRKITELCGLSPRENPPDTYGWVRDPIIWENLTDVRITHRATVDRNIEEAFADFYMASILYPDLLTEEEKIFFERIHYGLESNPEKFLEQVSEDPQFLLKGSN